LWVFFPNDLNDAWRLTNLATGLLRWPVLAKSDQSRLASLVYNIGAFFWYHRFLFYNLIRQVIPALPGLNLIWWQTYTNLAIQK
jgi:hypothetical protein